MPTGLLRPDEIGPADVNRILRFLNGVPDAQTLAETVGFSDGLAAGRRVATELIAARPFRDLDAVLAVTGVGLLRFTELAIALSAARPVLSPDTLTFLPVGGPHWLGQSITITAQLTNSEGRGIVTRVVTCVASDGVLTARAGLQVQSGSAIRIAPEPGGLVRFTYGPRLHPSLDGAARAALTAELSQLAGSGGTPVEAEKSMQSFAAKYRGQGATALQTAVDRLFETYDSAIIARAAPWPIQPVTLLALTHDENGQVLQATSLTLELRNWLGAFYVTLTSQIESDPLLPDALKFLAPDVEAGRDLSRKIIQATQGYAGLERGALGRRLRDAATTRTVNAFLDGAAKTLTGAAIINTVRAAGASEAAIASGGFKVFEAIRTVQEAEETIKPGSKFEGLTRADLLPLDQRLATLETTTVTEDDFTKFQSTLTAEVDSRFAGFTDDFAVQGDLDKLRDTLTVEFDTKLEGVSTSGSFDDRFAKIDDRLAGLEGAAISRSDLTALRNSLTRDFDAKLKTVEDRMVTDTRLDAVRAEMTNDIDTRLESVVARADVDAMIKAVETDMASKLRTKANASTVTNLRGSIDKMTEDQTKLRTDIAKLERRVGPSTGRGGITRR